MSKQNETIVLGGGCFWCTEAIFTQLKGVLSATPGYAGGTLKDPGYHEVSAGNTGHAEVIRLEFDPEIIPLTDILDVFWHTHDPTTLNAQGNDVGTQYRSVIFYSSAEQKRIAEESLANVQKSGEFASAIVTEIQPIDVFYEAETYHKDYYAKNSSEPYCQLIISPKLTKLREKYSGKLKK